VVSGGLRLAIVGIAVGLPIAFFGAWGLSSLLYGIKPWDPATFAAVPVFLICLAALAGYVPALRAARLNPLVALHHE
jgi:ABC-type antimicrobial peptide transport system permease subunit